MRMRCRLQEIMRANGITVAELARAARVGREPISTVHPPRGRRVRADGITRLCSALHVSVDDLFIQVPEVPGGGSGPRPR